ncbi:TPA: cytoplasmic protein, partial [Salmonella enterica]
MHVISKEPFDEAARRYPNDSLAIKALYRLVRERDFSSPAELRKVIPS